MYSYDAGWAFGGDELCDGFEAVFETPADRDQLGAQMAEALVDRWNGYVTRVITSADLVEPIDPLLFASGMWDSATSQCEHWFPAPDIAGRPGGGEVEPVDVPRVEGLESGSFVSVAEDLLRPVAAGATSTSLADESASYPRPPTSEEVNAIINYYDARNEASWGPAALRAFWLETAHPALGCTSDDMAEILLPSEDDPLWDDQVIMVPDLDSLLMVEFDQRYGPVGLVDRATHTSSDGVASEISPTRDHFFIVDGRAFQYFECEPDPSVEESMARASERAREILDRVHIPVDQGPMVVTWNELIAAPESLDPSGEFVVGMRWAWGDALNDLTDEQLTEQAEAVCDSLEDVGAKRLFDDYHAKGAGLSQSDLEQAMWSGAMFYSGGRTFCASSPEWRAWVRLHLELGFTSNYQDLTTAEELESGIAATLSEEEWTDFLVQMIEGTITKPLADPYEYGVLHAFGAARLATHG